MTSAVGSSEKHKEIKFNTTAVSFFIDVTGQQYAVSNIKHRHSLLFYILVLISG